LANVSVGSIARMLAGARWMDAQIQLMPICVLSIWLAPRITTRLAGWRGDRHCRMRLAGGVRSMR